MKELVEKIEEEGEVLEGGIIKVDSFLNHQINSKLMEKMGEELAKRFQDYEVTKILTAEVSGIPASLTTGINLGVDVIYARKSKPVTMEGEYFSTSVESPTKGGENELVVSGRYLKDNDRVLVIDDFIASGKTTLALVDLVKESNAELVGVGTAINKEYTGGRKLIESKGIKVETLADIDLVDNEIVII